MGYSPWGRKESGTTEATLHACMNAYASISVRYISIAGCNSMNINSFDGCFQGYVC